MSRVYVGNLSFNSAEETVRDLFTEFGDVREIHLPVDRESGRPRGFGFVTMESGDAAKKAIAALDGRMLDGRALRVNPADERPPGAGGGGSRGGYGGGRGGNRSFR